MLKSSPLLAGCLQCLSQCRLLLSRLEPGMLLACQADSDSVGAHLRHILERFQSLLQGLSGDLVDYDRRPRNRRMEVDLPALRSAFADLESQLAGWQEGSLQRSVLVRESVHSSEAPALVSSTLGRELMSLTSHTIHHLAIIAMVIKPLGIELDADFGKAPSTLRYELGTA
ncbi:MAG: hypothetical protein RLZZ385_666 [Pseudomonadota bacterium]|jgi:uncharacterized damage-inducible protein DinB